MWKRLRSWRPSRHYWTLMTLVIGAHFFGQTIGALTAIRNPVMGARMVFVSMVLAVFCWAISFMWD